MEVDCFYLEGHERLGAAGSTSWFRHLGENRMDQIPTGAFGKKLANVYCPETRVRRLGLMTGEAGVPRGI